MERKSQKVSLIASSVLLLALAVLTFWQTSLDFGDFRPGSSTETVVLWGVSTLVVIGVLALGFIVLRSLLKLYIERQQNRLGAKIKTKLVVGALALSILPLVCFVAFSFNFLNRTLDKWFTQPTREIVEQATALSDGLISNKSEADARRIASLPDVAAALETGDVSEALRERLESLADGETAHYIALVPAGTREPLVEFHVDDRFRAQAAWRLDSDPDAMYTEEVTSRLNPDHVFAAAVVHDQSGELGQLGHVILAWQFPKQVLDRLAVIEDQSASYAALHSENRQLRYFYLGMLLLIAIFVLFVATWLALFLSKQIVVPIEALVEATGELSSGHLDHRIRAPASDELGALVTSFNRMTQQLETKTQELKQSNQDLAQANVELEARRQFIDAILGSITPAVISVSAEGEILKVNSSLAKIFPPPAAASPRHLNDLFSEDDRTDLLRMMHRARRTGLATREFEIESEGQILHLGVTVSALEREEPATSEPARFVIVLEDTTELLRAQKSAAWKEVARRVAHEIKNPLTPIALSAERMSRLLKRYSTVEDTPERRKLREHFEKCTDTIVREVETLRALVDEFARLARFPSAKPERADLNGVIEAALDVFQGRLPGVAIRTDLAPHLPDVWVDPELFKRVIVNLIDNAAEALEDAWVREIVLSTAPGTLPDTVELAVADSGPGISAEDKEKLFLPYFSTKKRGTGLGLAIVNRILGEHNATIRVENNRPSGSRFLIEVPTAESRAPVEVGVGT